MLPRFLAAMGLSSSRHRAHNANTKSLRGLWDKPGSIHIIRRACVCVSPANIGQNLLEYSSLSSSLESSH